MARTLVRMVVLSGVVLGLAAPAAAGPLITRHPIYAGAEAYFGDCPLVPEPVGAFCTENHVRFYRGYYVEGGGSVAPSKALWYADAQTYRIDFDGTDEPPLTFLRTGEAVLAAGQATADPVHLRTASGTFSIPMDDGSTFAFSGTWTAYGPREHYGNDGPSSGVPTHFNDRCFTANAHAQQNFAAARMTGTLNGQPVQSYTDGDTAFIFNNAFRYVDVPHGGCA